MNPNAAAVAVSTRALAPAARLLARASAWLLLAAFLTGGYAAAALTGQIPVDAHTALAAHITAFLGCGLLIGVAWSLPLLRYGPVGQRRLSWCFIVPLFAGWFITVVKAALHVQGIAVLHAAANDTVFALLNVAVVVPSLVASVAWIYGLYGESAEG